MRSSLLLGSCLSACMAGCSVGDYEVTKGSFGAGPGGVDDEGGAMTGGATGVDTQVVTTGGPGAASEGDSEGPVGETEVTGGLSGTGELPAFCGDGEVDVNEGCDDGNQVDDDACRNDCSAAACGDGMVQTGEVCDDGNADESDGCHNNCVAASCGDGVVQVGVEGCDDGNQIDDDACSNSCKSGSCGDGVTQPGEGCDDGNANNMDACLNACTKATCGDGVVQAGNEQCDTGGASQQCNADCTLSKCGDAVTNVAAGEQCDTAGVSATCDVDCTSVVCGDNVINAAAGEQCDDGNPVGGDGCSPACKMEATGPKKCDQGTDPGTGSPWVVCEADANTAWLSSNNQGQFHILKICQNLGYKTVGLWGGTFGAVCGVNQVSSCQQTGKKTFSEGAWKGVGNCGQDGLGPLVCKWVQWTCVK